MVFTTRQRAAARSAALVAIATAVLFAATIGRAALGPHTEKCDSAMSWMGGPMACDRAPAPE